MQASEHQGRGGYVVGAAFIAFGVLPLIIWPHLAESASRHGIPMWVVCALVALCGVYLIVRVFRLRTGRSTLNRAEREAAARGGVPRRSTLARWGVAAIALVAGGIYLLVT